MAASSSRANEGEVVESGLSGRFSRYDIIIGKGSSKTVYKGFDEHFGTEIAWSKIKLSSGKQENRENLDELCEEPKLLMSLDHPNITKCYHYWKSDHENVVNMITEYCSSGNLLDYSRNHVQNLVDNTAIKNWCRQILNALHYLHTRDLPVTHRDVKCGNIFVKGDTSTVKLGDFGLAKEFLLGSKPAFATDIYSFGMALTQMVTPQMQFSECSSDRDLVEMGFKSVGVLGITDPQIKQLLFQCIIPPPDGPTAMDLLNDPFLAVNVVHTPTASGSDDGFQNLRETVKVQVAKLLLPPEEVALEFNIHGRKLRLHGKFSDHLSNSVSLKLIIDGNDRVTTIEFDLILEFDDFPDIVEGLNDEFKLFLADEVELVSEIMEQLVTELQDEPQDNDRNTVEDWCLQDLFLEEISSNNTSDHASSTHETSNDVQGQASSPPNSSQQNQETSNDGQGQASSPSNSRQQNQESSTDAQGQASSPSSRSEQDQETTNDAQRQANTPSNSSQQNQETSNDAQGQASSPSNRSQYNQDTEQQQRQSGRSENDNTRRGNRKLSSWLCCKKF